MARPEVGLLYQGIGRPNESRTFNWMVIGKKHRLWELENAGSSPVGCANHHQLKTEGR